MRRNGMRNADWTGTFGVAGAMCGFAALYSISGQEIDLRLLESMTHALRHRGPDDYGFAASVKEGSWIWREKRPRPFRLDGVAMGHRRLSIVDLSSAGRQPFVSGDGRYWMVYNGEIYNYRELRAELEALGHTFQTSTDTEVLLIAYAQWGRRCFARFNGMWAVLIWDARQRTLTASRDRFGVKPLYFAKAGDGWVFGSEAGTILRHPGVDSRPSEEAVFRFLQQHLQPPPGKTFFERVDQVEPGSVATFQDGRFVGSERYWELPGDRWIGEEHFDEAVNRVRELLSDAVRLRLRADVRVGTMLSGGLDSTSVIRNMLDFHGADGKLEERRSLGGSIQAFHAAYPGSDLDETPRVRELCGRERITLHEVFPARETELEDLYRLVVERLEMPFLNSVPVVQTLLMQRAKAEGVSVVLNGHGPDEMLGGYGDSYRRLAAAEQWLRGNWRRGWSEGRAARQAATYGGGKTLSALLWLVLPDNVVSAWAKPDPGMDRLVRPELRQRYPFLHWSTLTRGKAGKTALDRQLRFDFFERILPRWLQLEDRASMSASVESRLPFLDYRLVEYCFALDDPLKIKNGITKRVLREGMAGLLPESIVNETKKFRFSGPDSAWIRGALRPLVNTTLLDGEPLIAQFLDGNAMKNRLKSFLAGQGGRTSAEWMWTILNTEMWLRTFRSSQTRR
ncbi:MAG TPA: asparagine synthase (glutamine-hydrolyzing) [Verrucomicrobiales bacterium]|nr:asparagine synthase (glutamine-hydrolyzing) [Verrucomicrobiales bacterium]